MTKDYCPICREDWDEVYFDYGMCYKCYEKSQMLISVKYRDLRVRKGNTIFYYECNTVEWNYYLNRYYPVAKLRLTIEHLNREVNIKIN